MITRANPAALGRTLFRHRRAIRCPYGRVLAGLVALLSPRAIAQLAHSHFQMSWDAPDQCSPTRQFDDRLRALLGADPESILSAPLSVAAVVRQTLVGGWQVALSFTEQEETRHRQLTAPSCAELVDATALLVALAVDPNVQDRGATAEPASAPSASVSAESSANANPADTPAAQAKTTPPTPPLVPTSAARVEGAEMPQTKQRTWARFHPFLGLGPSVSFGVLPGVGFGGRAVGGLQSHHLRLSLEASLMASKPASLPGTGLGHADIYSMAVGFSPCWLVSFGSHASLGPCIMAELGLLRGRGEGLEATRSAEKPWGSLRFGGHAELELSRSARLVVVGDVGTPFGQPRFLLAGEEVHRPSSTVAGLQILGEMHFQ